MRFHFLLAGSILTTVLYAAQEEQEKPEETMRSVQSGVYTGEQADRGATIFEGECSRCHKPEDYGNGYLEGWSGQTAYDLIEHIRATMPQDSPGSLKRMEYVDVSAFIFRMNGLPAGDSEMDVSSVKQIRIEGPYTPQQ